MALKILKILMVLIVLVMGSIAVAMKDPLRDPSKLWEAQTEMVEWVESARVVVADYDLIRQDFPEIAHYSNEQIDQWLIRNTAFVSVQQAAQTNVNTEIRTGGPSKRRRAYRPREYRRAHVFATDTGGLIDVKGTGAVDPSGGSHDNGLATLGDMIREYSYEKLMNGIFQRDGRYQTVGSYGVVDFGFEIKHPGGGTSRAGTILRQAHTRYHDGPIGLRTRSQSTMLPRDFQLEVETFLRRFGITSTVKYDGKDLINLQGADNLAVIDFGSFLTEKKFDKVVVHFYDKQGNASGTDVVMSPGDEKFIQPNKDQRVPFDLWGYSQTGKQDSKFDNPYIWGHELAQALAEGRATRADVIQHLKNMFDRADVQNFFRGIHPSCRAIFKN